MERMNSKNIIMMWESIMHFHKEKSTALMSQIGGLSSGHEITLDQALSAKKH